MHAGEVLEDIRISTFSAFSVDKSVMKKHEMKKRLLKTNME